MAEKLNKNIWSLFQKNKRKMNNENTVNNDIETPEVENGVEDQVVEESTTEETKATQEAAEEQPKEKPKKKKRGSRGGSGAKKVKQLEDDVEALEKELVGIERERDEIKDK